MRKISIVDYDPNWAQQFQDLKDVFNDALKNDNIAIEHVGSTAVPGLASKPILDIDIIVGDENQLDEVTAVLATLGYDFCGDMGIKDRYAFQPISDLSPFTAANRIWPTHHLYCCIAGSISLQNHVLFRDALRRSPKLAHEYGALKTAIALTTQDIDVYVESKSSFIANVLERAGLSKDSVNDVISQNRKNT